MRSNAYRDFARVLFVPVGFISQGAREFLGLRMWLLICLLASPVTFDLPTGIGVTGLAGQGPDVSETAIVGATIVDLTTGELWPAMTVVISGERIATVGPADAVEVPPGSTVLPGEGRFLIPGLWDMHIHVSGREPMPRRIDFPLYIANGVTGVRYMSGDCDGNTCNATLETVRRWRADMATGDLVGPRVIASSKLFDGPAPMYGGGSSYALSDPTEARAKVHEARARGADFLKIYDDLPKDVHLAVLEEAHLIGIDAVGHVPGGVTVEEASAAGQKSFEHFDWTELIACSSNRGAAEQMRTSYWDNPSREGLDEYRRILVESFDEGACAPFFALLKANGTWHVPTLTYYLSRSRPDDAAGLTAERRSYLPPGIEGWWRSAGSTAMSDDERA